MEHQIQKLGSKWYRCNICQWQWQSKPKTMCPGLPRYSWQSKPDTLGSKTELGKLGLQLVPDQKARGIVQAGDGKNQWLLYDKREAIAKPKRACAHQKQPTLQKKLTRQPCPIGLDCLLVAAVAGKPCPNKYYCSDQARPWKLPLEFTIQEDGTKCLEVNTSSSSFIAREQREVGFGNATKLPFDFVESDLSKPILVVDSYRSEHEEGGWFTSENLDRDYPCWVAARNGASYKEFQEVRKDDTWWNHWCHSLNRQPYEREIPQFPHCILPGVW